MIIRNKFYDATKCIIYTLEERSRISMNIILLRDDGCRSITNNWTFDILTEDLFESIISNILFKYKNLKFCLVGLPGLSCENKIFSEDFLKLSSSFFKEVPRGSDLKIMFVNDVNAATYGYTKIENPYSNSNTTVGIFLPENFGPRAGIIINNRIYEGDFNGAGEVKHILPGMDCENFSPKSELGMKLIVSQLILSVNSILSPTEIIVFSDYISNELWESITKYIYEIIGVACKAKIRMNRDFKEYFETGLLLLSEDISNNPHHLKIVS